MTPSIDRRRRRKILYLVGLIPALLLLLVSGRIAVLLHHQDRAMNAYANGAFESAREHFAANQVLNPIEPWIAPFGEGDARYRLEDFDGAVTAFEKALEDVPEEHECMVRVNLALAHEAMGDVLAEEDDRLEAIDAWQEGRRVLRPCRELERERAAEDDTPAKDESREDRESRREQTRSDERDRGDSQAQSLEAAVQVDRRLTRKLGIDGPTETQDPEEAPPEDAATREKKQRLQERNRQAYEDSVEHKDEFEPDPEPTPPSPQPSPTPQW